VLTRKRRENGGQRRIASDKTPESILIVDDNESNLRLMEAILSTEDYEVRRAVDAEDALRLLEDWRPRLILMDIQLPGIDGLELTRRLKLDPSYKTTAIVALTAYAMKGGRGKGPRRRLRRLYHQAGRHPHTARPNREAPGPRRDALGGPRKTASCRQNAPKRGSALR